LGAAGAFYLSARLALNADDHAWNGNLRWDQQPSAYLMTFNTPTGQGALQLKGDPSGVRLLMANGETQTADDAEDLLYNQTGLDFPVHGLRYWILGLPSPDKDSLRSLNLDPQGQLVSLQQSGWTIHYRRYQTIDAVALPRKLDMQHDNIKIRIVIDHWELSPQPVKP